MIGNIYVRKAYVITYTGEALQKGKAKYSWPPCANQFRSAASYIENVIYIYYKTSRLNKEFNFTESFPLIRVPCWAKYILVSANIKTNPAPDSI